MTPPNESPSISLSTLALRVVRKTKTVKVVATNVHSQAFESACLFGVSSMDSAAWSSNRLASSSYVGRRAAVAVFCNFTTQPGEHG